MTCMARGRPRLESLRRSVGQGGSSQGACKERGDSRRQRRPLFPKLCDYMYCATCTSINWTTIKMKPSRSIVSSCAIAEVYSLVAARQDCLQESDHSTVSPSFWGPPVPLFHSCVYPHSHAILRAMSAGISAGLLLGTDDVGLRAHHESDRGHSTDDDDEFEEHALEAERQLEQELAEHIHFVHDGRIYAPFEADATVREHGKAFAGRVCGMTPTHPIRARLILMAADRRLENVILLVIFVNCFFLLLEAPIVAAGSPEDLIEQMLDHTCMGIFTLELLVKLAAHGVAMHRGAYLNDPWNLIDLAVVAPYWVLIFFPNMPSLSSIRLVRALRPLRTIRNFPELRRMVEAFLRAGPALSTVTALTAFFFLVFGIVGVELYKGSLHTRCGVLPATSGDATVDGLPLEDEEAAEIHYCGDNPLACAHEATQGHHGASNALACHTYPSNPHPRDRQLFDFDNIWHAGIVILQLTTFDRWHIPMYEYAKAVPSISAISYFFFNSATILGGAPTRTRKHTRLHAARTLDLQS